MSYTINDVAIASLANDGSPMILYNPSVLGFMYPQTRLFFYAHECGHHALGHNFGTTHPLRVEQDADCFAIQELVDYGYLSDADVDVIQYDISRFGRGDWTHLPGPQRAINLDGCLYGGGSPPAPQPAPQPAPLAYYCHTPYGSCGLGSPLQPGAACYCPSPYGPVTGLAGN